MTRGIAIAIDGPAGSGKSTIAKAAAARFQYVYVDTGAMYRAVTLNALERGIPVQDGVGAPAQITALAEATDIRLAYRFDGPASALQVWLDGSDVTEAIRSLEVTNNVSAVAAIAGVRTAMVRLQQRMAASGGVVMDGRDIGTVVLPKAELKIFLTASVAVRTQRRWLELQAKGITVATAELEKQIEQRDYLDSHRETDPLRQAEDAILLDTTHLPIEEVIDTVVSWAVMRGASLAE